MSRLGIISGTIILQGIVDNPEDVRINTAFGPAQVFLTDRVAFIPRHGTGTSGHILPHLINHGANLSALKALGVEEVIAVNSTGSLKQALKPGMLVVPDDFIMLSPGPTVIQDRPAHVTPALDAPIRERWLAAGRDCNMDIIDGGVYWQTVGPRFETKAEIRFMAPFADLVGMTMASEAIVAKELDMAYASLCSIDNYANGLVNEPLNIDEIVRCSRLNAVAVVKIIMRYLERRML
jgi:5'-methylthioadenosine phosphorylase